MIKGINFYKGITNSFADNNNTDCEATNNRKSYPQYKELSKEANSASIAYATPIIKESEIPQMSLNSLIKNLKIHGKRENKDFTIEKSGNGNIILTINNKLGQPLHKIHYDNGDLNHWNVKRNYKYQNNGKLNRIISKSTDNKIEMYTDYYDNKEVTQDLFTKEGLTYNTTPEEYIEYLKQNKINYQISRDENSQSVVIDEFDENNKKTQTTDFHKYGVFRSEFNLNEEKIKNIDLTKERTEVTNYQSTFKSKTYKTNEINPKYFTNGQITYNTTPESYINYLEQNNIKYKIEKFADHICIKELDSNGKVQNENSWVYDDTGLERITRWEYKENGRRRLDFLKDETDELIVKNKSPLK